MPELSNSGHFPIKLTLCYTNSFKIHTRELKWKLTNADLNIYQIEIKNKKLTNSTFSNENNVDENTEKFSNIIRTTDSDIFE